MLILNAPVLVQRIFAVLLVAMSASTVERVANAADVGMITRSFFGMHAHRLDVGTPWPSSEVGSFRTWDAKVRWADLQPRPDRWVFSRLDYLVAAARQRNVGVLIPLGMPAAWASLRPTEPSAYGPGEAAPPALLTDWENYVRTVASRYKGQVEAYEIWNEPNLSKFFSGTPLELVHLTCSAYRVIKKVDPAAKVVSPAPLGDYGVQWLDRFLAAGGGECFDVLGYHFYNKHRDPETHVQIFRDIRQVELKYGLDKRPVWNTETGWLIASTSDPVDASVAGFSNDARVLGSQLAAAIIARTLVLHASIGVSRVYWYALDNHAMGLLERDGTPKLALASFLHTAKLLTGKSVGTCTPRRASWTCDVLVGKAVVATIMWKVGPGQGDWERPSGALSAEVLGHGSFSLAIADAKGANGDVVVYWLR